MTRPRCGPPGSLWEIHGNRTVKSGSSLPYPWNQAAFSVPRTQTWFTVLKSGKVVVFEDHAFPLSSRIALSKCSSIPTPRGSPPTTPPAPRLHPRARRVSADARGSVAGVRSAALSPSAGKTGYPPEMLELDLDLQADLGVDMETRP